MAEKHIPSEATLSEVKVGNMVQYGWLKKKSHAEPLCGIVGYSNLKTGEIDIVVTRENRMSKVSLHAGFEVIDLGFQPERSIKYHPLIPGIRP